MTPGRARPRTLGRIVVGWVSLFALVALTAQAAWMLSRYLGSPDHMASHLVDRELAALVAGVTVKDGRPGFQLPAGLSARYGAERSGYVARLRTTDGTELFTSCDDACLRRAFADAPAAPLYSWRRRLSPGYPLSVAGGERFETAAGPVVAEVAIDRDPQHAIRWVLVEELFEEMLLPTGIALGLAIAAAVVAVRRSLAPVEAASAAADALDPRRPDIGLDPAGMPLEIERLVGAVNRSYARLAELMTAQRVFTAAISHEIRTPLAAVRLELDAIDHPRARRARKELDELVAFANQLTELARLEASRPRDDAVDLEAAASDVVATIAPWLFDRGASIALAADGASRVAGDDRLIRNALRNLVENAVRHGGPGVSITVRVGPGPTIAVEDDGRAGPDVDEQGGAHAGRDGRLGMGLEIVRRIAALHRAEFRIAAREPRGVEARLDFPPGRAGA